VYIQIVDIMDRNQPLVGDGNRVSLPQITGPSAHVHIAPYRSGRGNFFQGVDYFRIADIAGVDDQIGVLKNL